jgi:hypothetical protein
MDFENHPAIRPTPEPRVDPSESLGAAPRKGPGFVRARRRHTPLAIAWIALPLLVVLALLIAYLT